MPKDGLSSLSLACGQVASQVESCVEAISFIGAWMSWLCRSYCLDCDMRSQLSTSWDKLTWLLQTVPSRSSCYFMICALVSLCLCLRYCLCMWYSLFFIAPIKKSDLSFNQKGKILNHLKWENMPATLHQILRWTSPLPAPARKNNEMIWAALHSGITTSTKTIHTTTTTTARYQKWQAAASSEAHYHLLCHCWAYEYLAPNPSRIQMNGFKALNSQSLESKKAYDGVWQHWIWHCFNIFCLLSASPAKGVDTPLTRYTVLMRVTCIERYHSRHRSFPCQKCPERSCVNVPRIHMMKPAIINRSLIAPHTPMLM